MVQNRGVIFKRVPEGMPIAGQDLTVESRNFDLESSPPPGGIIVKNLYASYDPYMRSRMNGVQKDLYFELFELDKPIISFVVAQVYKSDTSKHPKGQFLVGLFPVEEYSYVSHEMLESPLSHAQPIQNPYNLDIYNFLGALGMPGLTAYGSLYEIGKPKEGETIFVSAASGAVGQLVGQLAQREGLKVIGSVGSNEKLDFILKELKFDGGFNYKVEKPMDALRRLVPKGVDIYYDNVGGEQLEAALGNMNRFGRIVICGMVSQYNNKQDENYGIRNLILTIPKSLTLRGFLVSDKDIGPKYFEERNKNFSKWISEGSIKVKTSIVEGIENGPQGFVDMMDGKNFGKAVLKIADI